MKFNSSNYPNFAWRGGFGRLIQDAFDGLEDFGELLSSAAPGNHRPSADLFEDANHFFVTLELPGVSKTDLHVELIEAQLNISATLSRETANGRKNIPFKRSIALPEAVGTETISAKLQDGILTVTLPKSEATKPRSITIE